MTQPTNTHDSYDSIGNKEDVRDIIYNIDPTATPFMTNAGGGKATNTLHEWQTQALAAASATNAQIEGDDATLQAVVPTVRLGNYTQISSKTAVVSGTIKTAVDKYGRGDEMSYAMALNARELKRDMESSLTANNAKVAGNSTTARELGGLGSWIVPDAGLFQTGSSGANPTGDGSDARTDDGTPAALTEAQLNQAIRQAWTAGGEPNMIMCGPFNKTTITGFAGNATLYKDISDKKIMNAVDVYVSDFGELSVVPNRFQRERDVFVLDMDMWDVPKLRDFETYDLSKTGDSTKKQMLVEYTLVSKQKDASSGIFDVTAS